VKTLFWVSMFLVVYTYLGYPLVLWAVAKIRPRDVRRDEISPLVSVIIAARNEAEKIRQKIEHTNAQAYTKERL
jgi:cellulose synthase/poly-beta-1,6-N-acetylglucosamine synthase-like glycosyltransferase